MAYFEWDMSLDVYVDAMNEEHKKLVSLMNTLYDRNAAGAPKQEVLQCLQNLGEYCIQHFKNEEAFMTSINFPGLEVHKKLHGNLLTDFTKYVDDFKNSSSEKISNELSIFLKFWLSTHIRGVDTKYGVHAQEKTA